VNISPSRELAFDVLLRVEQDAAFASDLLHARRSVTLSPADAALATELVMGTLRWQQRLDYTIDRHLKSTRLDIPVRVSLRMGAYQLLFLTRVPPHAAVNESVELVKRAGVASAAGLVNAVLRKPELLLRREDFVASLPRELSRAERLAIELSHPVWLVERWLRRFDESGTRALLAAGNAPPPLSLILSPGDLAGSGFSLPDGGPIAPSPWLRAAFRLTEGAGGFVSKFAPLLHAGIAAFQDEASQMVAHLVGAQAGDRVLDLCAAPGGKTAVLARAAGTTGRVVAADLHPHRLRATRDRFVAGAQTLPPPFDRLTPAALAPLDYVVLDGERSLPFTATFHRILVDAPCSGTGTLARHPEIRWRLSPSDLAALQRKQCALLQQAAAFLVPRGRLVYSTCSLEPEENEQVVELALAALPDLCRTDARAALAPHLAEGADARALFDAQGYFRTLPSEHGTDGFFAAVVEKKP
jgi:16S rRNA (cytosine967-C5)-methyltransferase